MLIVTVNFAAPNWPKLTCNVKWKCTELGDSLIKLSHIDADNRPTMVDVSDKKVTVREAHAQTIVRLPGDIVQHISGEEIGTKKGPVFATAIIAGVMAAKKTHE